MLCTVSAGKNYIARDIEVSRTGDTQLFRESVLWCSRRVNQEDNVVAVIPVINSLDARGWAGEMVRTRTFPGIERVEVDSAGGVLPTGGINQSNYRAERFRRRGAYFQNRVWRASASVDIVVEVRCSLWDCCRPRSRSILLRHRLRLGLPLTIR